MRQVKKSSKSEVKQRSEKEVSEIYSKLKKCCSGIQTHKGRTLVNWFGQFFYLHPNGNRFISKGEILYGKTTVKEWLWATDTWVNPDGTKAQVYELKDLKVYQAAATVAMEIRRNPLFGMFPDEKDQAVNQKWFTIYNQNRIESKNAKKVAGIVAKSHEENSASNRLGDFISK